MAAQGDIEAADREFAIRMENLRRVAAQWVERPIAPEVEVLSALVAAIDQIGTLCIEARRASIRAVAESRLVAEQQRETLAQDTIAIRSHLRDGIEAVHTLRTINEKLVEKKLLAITADMTKGLRGAIESQATAMTRRYNLQTAFRILGYSSIVLIAGFALGRMP
ncbi:hypothetical protein [Komagataeibacter oboediens]|uniref:hypothetical protein n=1 Tax=Komagataeibacter oboediens TaxID=65958 RepID=UPI0019041DB6|nr:hypothetical protein [Komagataeibacter oboediens]GCE80409.1 hypothetical protein MSKU3_1884 [Komagataeibacter oboediens]